MLDKQKPNLKIKIGMSLDEIEKLVIFRTLQCSSGDKTATAKILGISLKTLQRKLKSYISYRLDLHQPSEGNNHP
jgi:DNA-binding NtrC family response regulator